MTGAAVAVGQNTQMKAPCATTRSTGSNPRYTTTPPRTCTAASSHDNRVMRILSKGTLQKVTSSIANIRYGAKKATASI